MLKDRIRRLRLEKGMTQKEVADKLGTNYQTYQQWERGVRSPKLDSLERLSNIFSVTTDYLIGNEDEFEEIFNIIRKNIKTEEDKNSLKDHLNKYFNLKNN